MAVGRELVEIFPDVTCLAPATKSKEESQSVIAGWDFF
jgi:hypothetical protein